MAIDSRHAVAVATLEDLDSIMELERVGFAEPERWSRQSWRSQLITPSLRVLRSPEPGERPGDQLDGVIALRFAGEVAELDRIVVAPAVRRRGVARRLITAGCAEAAGAGAHQMILEVRSENVAAITLYRSIGFAELTVRQDYYGPGQDAMIMKLIMTANRTVPS